MEPTCFERPALRRLSSCEHALCLADEPVHFVLLMPFSGSWKVGPRIAGAAELAVNRVNADKALLPRRQLEYSWTDSGCSAQQGLEAMGELLRGASQVGAVIGPGCRSIPTHTHIRMPTHVYTHVYTLDDTHSEWMQRWVQISCTLDNE